MKRLIIANASQTEPVLVQPELPLKEQLRQRLLDRYDLQELFGVTRGTIYNWCRKGLLRFTKIGGKKYFDAIDVDALIEKNKQTLVPGSTRKKRKKKLLEPAL